MSLREELEELMENLGDPAEEFERFGISDRAGIARYAMTYARAVADVLKAEGRGDVSPLIPDFAAILVGGFQLGLVYARKHKEGS